MPLTRLQAQDLSCPECHGDLAGCSGREHDFVCSRCGTAVVVVNPQFCVYAGPETVWSLRRCELADIQVVGA